MTDLRDFIHGPWRAVPVLGITQILSWGTIFYTPVLMVPLIAAERHWSISFAMGGFSVGLLVAGLGSPFVGRSIDRFGGHVVMTIGSLIGGLGLFLIVYAAHPIAYYAVWMVSWPATHFLIDRVSWQSTYLIYAALLVCIAAPLHAAALPRSRYEADVPVQSESAPPVKVLPPYGLPFILVAAAFASYAFVPSGLSAHLLTIFGRTGIDPGTVVWIGALFGPAQVGARLIEFSFGRNLHPLWVARFALTSLLCAFIMLAFLGVSTGTAAAFALMFGGANGLVTITRGAVPLALFGASSYGRLIGRLAAPFLLVQSAAPLVMAFVIEHTSDPAALALAAGFATVALICFVAIRRPN